MAKQQKLQRDFQAPIIKFSAVFAAVTRWTGALLAAEGFGIIDQWLGWWLPLSAALGAFMAMVEGWAFAYIFQQWWTMRNKERQHNVKGMSGVLLILVIIAAVTFILVLTPYIAAQAQRSNLYQVPGQIATPILNSKVLLLAWAACVGASTISIVASVGIAQGAKAEVIQMEKQSPNSEGVICELCGQKVKAANTWSHMAKHQKEIAQAGNLPNAIESLDKVYPKLDKDTLREWVKEAHYE